MMSFEDTTAARDGCISEEETLQTNSWSIQQYVFMIIALKEEGSRIITIEHLCEDDARTNWARVLRRRLYLVADKRPATK